LNEDEDEQADDDKREAQPKLPLQPPRVHMALYSLLDLGATNAYELLESSSSHRSSLHSCTNSCRSGMTNIEPAGTTDRLGYTTSRDVGGCVVQCHLE